jgi:indolepyruvate ferredoxin oxidoreductase alpha subunit
VLETVAKHNDGTVYVEWSVNEKSALETAAGPLTPERGQW